MKTSDFDYTLPPERIAQVPLEPRHSSRLLVYSRGTKQIEHSVFWHLERFLKPGDLLVLNQTKVIPARIHAFKPTGGRVELLLLKKIDLVTWEALVGGKHMKTGISLLVEKGPSASIIEELEGSKRLISTLPFRIRTVTRRFTPGSVVRQQRQPPGFISPRN
jgi:S-adenosylmethionine:tRNA ribosyltransferase-isomerase